MEFWLWLWSSGCSVLVGVFWLWSSGCGVLVVEFCFWGCCSGILVVDLSVCVLLSGSCCLNVVVCESLLSDSMLSERFCFVGVLRLSSLSRDCIWSGPVPDARSNPMIFCVVE